MNEEELAALADKLLAQGLGEDEILEHLSNAKHGGAPAEEGELDATSPVEAASMHAIDALSMGLGDRPGKGSGYGGGEGGRQMLSDEDRQSREMSADERELALAIAEQEHPTASKVGRYGTLALPIVGLGPKGVASLGKGLASGGGRMLKVIKGMMGEAPIVGKRGMLGRPIRAGMKAFAESKPPVIPKAPIKTQGGYPSIEGGMGGEATMGLSAGEARALNAPRARAAELAARKASPLKAAKAAMSPSAEKASAQVAEDALTQGARARVQPHAPKARFSKFAADQAERFKGFTEEQLRKALKSGIDVTEQSARAELVRRGIGMS